MRPFAESVTGFASRYTRDIFYRTGWNVVLLQLGFAVALLVVMLLTLSVMYDEVVRVLIESIMQTLTKSIETGMTPALDGSSIAYNLEYEKQRAMVLSGAGILAIAATFGYLITKIALVPTQRALESQKQFVGNVAHELRTPLSVIKTNTEVALFNEKLDPDTTEMLRSNVEELDRISSTINNLLSMNALLRPERMEFSNVDLSPIIDRVRSSLADLIEHKRIEVTVTLTGNIVWGNATALEQIAMNIVKNALYYTPVGGTVHIRTEPNGSKLDFIVSDTGMGIEEKDLERVFEPFYRGDRSRNRASGGSGLGLAIVSELVKLHKGAISIKSTVGQGTVVNVSLPQGRRKEKAKALGKQRETGIDFSKR